MKPFTLGFVLLMAYPLFSQHLHIQGTSWFQGDNTPLPPMVGAGIGIGLPTGSSGGYIFAHDYSSSLSKNLWLQHPGGNVLIGHMGSAAGKLDVRSSAIVPIYASTTSGYAIQGISSDDTGVYGNGGSIGVFGIGPNGIEGYSNSSGGGGVLKGDI